MARIQGTPNVELHITIQLSESEARALDAMAGYGANAFIEVFYEKLGKAYMQDHESGLRTFLSSIRKQLPRILAKATEARNVFLEEAAKAGE